RDPEFRRALETEEEREEEGQFAGLLVKNLENIQGDERDVVILSICYGRGRDGRMLMNFGPINQTGGEKRLNVAFSRAKAHMAIVSSIHYSDIRNVYNDGANCFRSYLQYAEMLSAGDLASAAAVLRMVGRRSKGPAAPAVGEAVTSAVASALRTRGYLVEENV